MGLDQYLYMARKATRKECEELKAHPETSSQNFIILRSDESCYEHVKDLCTHLELPEQRFNKVRFWDEYEIVKDLQWNSLSSDTNTVHLHYGDVKDGIDIEMDYAKWSSFFDEYICDHVAFIAFEIAYWRKNWSLQDWLEEELEFKIGNCDYVELPTVVVQKMVDREMMESADEYGDMLSAFSSNPNRIPMIGTGWSYVYHPWW